MPYAGNSAASINNSGTLTARELDFAMQFQKNWDLLKKIMNILRMVKKQDGTTLAYYTTKRIGEMQPQTGEGEATVSVKYEVVKAGTYDIVLERHEKETSPQAVQTWGSELALAKTDKAFMDDLQYGIMDRFYNFLKLGTLTAVRPTFVGALAAAKGSLINRAAALHITVGEVVGFCGVMDLYNYLGEQQVTIQNAFGLQYVENFLGYRILFLLPDTILSGKCIATFLDNIICYYVDPGDDSFTKLGLMYTTTGETPLIGVHLEPDYKHGTGSIFAVLGLTLFAERIDLISNVTITKGADTDGAVTVVADDAMDAGSPATGVSAGKRKSTS